MQIKYEKQITRIELYKKNEGLYKRKEVIRRFKGQKGKKVKKNW